MFGRVAVLAALIMCTACGSTNQQPTSEDLCDMVPPSVVEENFGGTYTPEPTGDDIAAQCSYEQQALEPINVHTKVSHRPATNDPLAEYFEDEDYKAVEGLGTAAYGTQPSSHLAVLVVVTKDDRYVQVFVDQTDLATVDKIRPVMKRLLDKLD